MLILIGVMKLYLLIDNSSIERVEEFKYLGTTLTNKNSIQEEIKSRLKLWNACYYSVQNLLSPITFSDMSLKRVKTGIRFCIPLKLVYFIKTSDNFLRSLSKKL